MKCESRPNKQGGKSGPVDYDQMPNTHGRSITIASIAYAVYRIARKYWQTHSHNNFIPESPHEKPRSNQLFHQALKPCFNDDWIIFKMTMDNALCNIVTHIIVGSKGNSLNRITTRNTLFDYHMPRVKRICH